MSKRRALKQSSAKIQSFRPKRNDKLAVYYNAVVTC